MKHSYWSLLALLTCLPVHAGSNLVTNPYLPYPPACMEAALAVDFGQAESATFFDEEFSAYNLSSERLEYIPVRLKAWRSPCGEPDRSLIWLEFSVREANAGKPFLFELFSPVADLGSDIRKTMMLAADPGGWGAGHNPGQEFTLLSSEPRTIDGWNPDKGERKWTFLLENGPFPDPWGAYWGLTPEEYNSGFKLVLRYPPYDNMAIDVPATADVLPPAAPGLALSGRLSGIWAVDGAQGQGFHFAISEQVPSSRVNGSDYTDSPLVFFFTHYTFDADNRPVWLAGSVEFEPGAGAVTLPVTRLENGTFRGGSRAERVVIGEVTITANSCDDLDFEYDYGGLGLGTGQARLQRVYSLETAGYDCRDYAARVAANH